MTFTCFEGQLVRLLADVIIQSSDPHPGGRWTAGTRRRQRAVRSDADTASGRRRRPTHLLSRGPVCSTSFFPFLGFFSGVHS